ncbi:kinase-like domain-containing protein, partial [Lentinula lateritia]
YETFSYRKTVCHLSSNSDTYFEILADSHEIEVLKGWVKYVKAGAADGGYISKGLYKYCISARVEGKQVALFMHKPVGSSNELNKTGLHAELDLLTQGNGFAQSFKLHASAAEVKVPGKSLISSKFMSIPMLFTTHHSLTDLKYNAENAFIGTIDSCLAARPLPIDDMAIESNEECSLLFDTFLVVPLLQTKGVFTERKFSGNTQTGDNTDYIGEVVDAFVHHVLEETNRTSMLADIQGVVGPDRSIMLFDPQAHSSTGDSGEWDQGNEVIEKFCEEHHCNNICHKLLLTSLQKEQVENLSAHHSLTYIMDQ